MTTLFEKIVNIEIPSEIVFENERILAFKDIKPLAPVHLLIIPKKVIPNIQSVTSEDMQLITEIFSIAQKLAKEFQIEKGYRLMVNNGEDAGQTVFHLHFHLIGGKKLSEIV